MLDDARVPNLVAYERLADREPLPSLLVVIDEFALLVERQPEVRDRLDMVATQGRSLGVHLLLATQSPSGVITHPIRTNTNLWICLRVVSDSESMELLGAKDAARIADGSPGKGFVRLGAAPELRSFQAARIARPIDDQASAVHVRRVDGTSDRSGAPRSEGRDRTELDVVVERIVAAATATDRRAASTLWLPPLPAVLAPTDVGPIDRTTGRLEVLVGLADQPHKQAQAPYVIDLSASGNAMFGGLFGYGKTTALLQVAADLAAHHPADEVHLYGIDAGAGSLRPILALPHTGDVVGANDVERLSRLLDRLTTEVDVRREQLGASGSGDFLRWRAAGGDAPWIVLLVDDYPSFREVAEQVEMGRLVDRFGSLLQNGPAVGIHVVLTVSQGVDLRHREASLVPARLFFRAADASDYAMVEPRLRLGDLPALGPGRAIGRGGAEVQVCWADPDAFGPETPDPNEADPRRPRRVRRLPTTVSAADLDEPARGVAVGLGGPDVSTVAVDLTRGVPRWSSPVRSDRVGARPSSH